MAPAGHGRIEPLDFECLAHQGRFLEAVCSGHYRNVALVGGAGCGKTKVISMAGIALAAMMPGLPGIITEPTYEMAVQILEPTIADLCEEYEIPYRFRAREHAFEFPWWGSKILCRSGEKPRRLRGPNAAWAGMDEAGDQVEEVLTTLQGRVRHPRARTYDEIAGVWRVLHPIMVVGTPRGFNWVYERFAEPGGPKLLPSSHFIPARAADNVYITENDPLWIETMRATYDAELFEQEVLGEFVEIGAGKTYYSFDKEKNLRRLPIDPELPLLLTCDFNRTPMAWLVVQCAGRWHPINVVDEIAVLGSDTSAACTEFLRRYRDHKSSLRAIYGDASGHTRTTKSNYSDYDIMQNRLGQHLAIYAPKHNLGVRDRVNAMNAKLCNAKGDASLFIDPGRCPNLIRDLQKARNVKGTLEPDKNAHDPHFADALGYYVRIAHPIQARRAA